ncbi:hypothetical protein I6A60_24130 [Frankia sp. AgB1.9]|uniref:hypothetical protein n=1 Tax=unclassified Frankia TaxID=2632575 RepID=UPI001931C7AB|nr:MULTISPECIES: hypothetical protein [unclassified Frankia]MBL7490882.1 hypothetical protein [Frankia sp. AgW1.1]MBL7550934.1 hypothetical protein [Frankia sp. AgB1.9]MBL7624443.1 hypothetical protein [Frankia sp. AgB1.8]
MSAITQRIGVRPYLGLFALARCGLGIAALTRPVTALRATGVDRVTAERTAWTARLLGGRDLALGAGLLHALSRRQPTDSWVWAGLIADAVDATVLATATARRDLSPAAGTLAALLGAGAAAAALPVLADPDPGDVTP